MTEEEEAHHGVFAELPRTVNAPKPQFYQLGFFCWGVIVDARDAAELEPHTRSSVMPVKQEGGKKCVFCDPAQG